MDIIAGQCHFRTSASTYFSKHRVSDPKSLHLASATLTSAPQYGGVKPATAIRNGLAQNPVDAPPSPGLKAQRAAGPRPTSPREGAFDATPAEPLLEYLHHKVPKTNTVAPTRGRARPCVGGVGTIKMPPIPLHPSLTIPPLPSPLHFPLMYAYKCGTGTKTNAKRRCFFGGWILRWSNG